MFVPSKEGELAAALASGVLQETSTFDGKAFPTSPHGNVEIAGLASSTRPEEWPARLTSGWLGKAYRVRYRGWGTREPGPSSVIRCVRMPIPGS